MNITNDRKQNTVDALECSSDWVGAHGDFLFNFALGQVRDAGIAEDLVQDTFLAALKSGNSFSGRSSGRTWLVAILLHKICDQLRRTCRARAFRVDPPRQPKEQEARSESLLWLHEIAAESQSPSRRLELQEFRNHLELALGRLPPRVAQVFQLYEMEQCPNSDICERLNISQSNLWVMLHRARKQLREQLRAWWFGEPAPEPARVALNL